MSVWEKFKIWFWGDLKEESKPEPESVEKPKRKRAPRKPKVPETTDEFLEKEVNLPTAIFSTLRKSSTQLNTPFV